MAAAQMAPVLLDRDATVSKVCDWIKKANAKGADWIAFPETIIPGYPYWLLTMGNIECRPVNLELFKNAITVPGPETEAICEAAHRAECGVAIGVNERAGGTLYNTQVFISPEDNGSVFNTEMQIIRYNWI